MTGFNDFLSRVRGLPSEPNISDAIKAIALYRKQFSRLTKPGGWNDLRAIRQQRKKPSGRIVVTDDFDIATGLRDEGKTFPILISGFAAYDFSPLFNLDVLYLIPDTDLFALEVAFQIAEVEPKTFAIQWPGNEREELLWSL